jgi:hypothetical protein
VTAAGEPYDGRRHLDEKAAGRRLQVMGREGSW